MKIKTLKEYLSYMGGFRLGYVDNITPIASLGDVPPKGQAGKDSRGVGLNANYDTQAPGTMRPFLTANTEKKKIEMMKLTRKAMSTMPGSQKQKEIKIQLNKVRKELGLDPIKEDTNRIPRKPGQKAGSDKHSDLYTDENPKGTIHGLGFTDAETARTSVNK